MQRQEIAHHTDEQVAEYARKAAALVELLEPPDDLRAAMFTQAMMMYGAKQVMFEKIEPTLLGQARGFR